MEVNIIIRFAESTIAEITILDIETELSHHYPKNEPIRESRLAYVTPEMNIKFEIKYCRQGKFYISKQNVLILMMLN